MARQKLRAERHTRHMRALPPVGISLPPDHDVTAERLRSEISALKSRLKLPHTQPAGVLRHAPEELGTLG